jgi:carbonic anhydrase
LEQAKAAASVDQQVNTILIVLLVFGFVALIIGIFIVAAIIGNKRERERTEQVKRVASLMGWEFSEAAPMNWIPNLEQFALFSQGHSKTVKNVMYGQLEGLKVAVFDYQYVVGSGKNRSTYNQSVVYFEPRNLNAPFFSLRPEHTFHKIIAAFGYQDIDFGNRPTFSSKYLLRGADEPAVRSLFNDALLGFYEMNQGSSADGGGNQLFIFRQNHRPGPHEAQAFINWALQVQRLYASRW